MLSKEVTLEAIQEMIDGSHNSLAAAMEKGFKAVDERFVAIDERFAVVDARFDCMDKRFDGVDERINDLHEAMQLHATETDRQFREIRSGMATKDYVDDRIGELRGEFRQALKRSQGGQARA